MKVVQTNPLRFKLSNDTKHAAMRTTLLSIQARLRQLQDEVRQLLELLDK